jgi:hypothetical protein
MTRLLRYFLLFTLLFVAVGIISAQDDNSIRGYHKVKRKETIFGISRMYEITIEELIEANPEMRKPDYELKKGDILRIPFSGKAGNLSNASQTNTANNTTSPNTSSSDDVRNRAIRLGVMLPLHDINGDGRRMVEYYRGVLMACDSLKALGISVDVHAWNTPEDGDIRPVLLNDAATRCDIIIGPLYSKQMDVLSEFVKTYDIRLVIPFSINAPQLTTNRNIFQIWQSPTTVNEETINRFMERFKDYHPVFIDCNDTTSNKGIFTFGLRRQLEQQGIEYSITNLNSSEESFFKAFSVKKQNVVILNTGRQKELGIAFSKINVLKMSHQELDISMFGYTDWLRYTRTHLENFYKFNTYIPSVFYYNPVSTATKRLEQKYRWNFHTDMQNVLPRFAIAGFDHAYFFLRGLHKYGKTFNGAPGMFGYQPVQTPLQFERYGNGGLRNRTLLFVHYRPEHVVETIKF